MEHTKQVEAKPFILHRQENRPFTCPVLLNLLTSSLTGAYTTVLENGLPVLQCDMREKWKEEDCASNIHW